MPTEAEIDEVLNRADAAEEAGKSQWPSMSYEQGVAAALRWARGEIENNPMEDEDAVEREIKERTQYSPDYPGLLSEAEITRAREHALSLSRPAPDDGRDD